MPIPLSFLGGNNYSTGQWQKFFVPGLIAPCTYSILEALMNTTAAAERHLILLRGLPGAGKSSLAKVLSENKWPVYAIDDFFTHPVTGLYNFRYEDNHLAYKACENNTESALEKGIEKVFVDNTFTLAWELEPYFKLAKKYGYSLHVVTVENHHGGTNSHGVSEEQVKKMAAKYAVKLY